ncbi:hypothetical protein [Natrarchaeobaculum sulfurireducens]|uniref:Uncharacterized protein n=1 Tax=Natrarchaeobaculum sulfurireducens TaxID=2044521 RepID=A0A346PD74_9EURY|nr:hypothetical protein [Natrarchaeobaculum sulfurireducens]AXR77469.1 hypothetical protein AArc1_1128 [Natrarchaeobaculum sulfurireducens]AXR82560.1 hypothetical protein AArcMg_2570 [Natrarchaeobaculum sulfurireducens]
MTTHIKLHGSKARRFETIKGELSERMGYDLSNPEVLGLLMSSLESHASSEGEGAEPTEDTCSDTHWSGLEVPLF